MATYYVSDDTGSDSNTGTEASPLKSISQAFYNVGMATASTIIVNDSAVYDVTNHSTPHANPDSSNQIIATTGHLPTYLTIKAGDGCTPIFDGGHVADFLMSVWNNWTIQGLEIRKFGGSPPGYAIQQTAGNQNSHVQDCTIHAITGSAIYLLKDNTTVQRCTIYDCTNKAVYGLYQFVVKNNLIYDCQGEAIWGGISGVNTADTVVRHNTIRNCPSAGSTASARRYAISTRTDCRYNIVTNAVCATAAIYTYASNSEHSYNLVSGTLGYGSNNPDDYSSGAADGAGTGDLTDEDPQFVSIAGGRWGPSGSVDNDFSLQQTSPCMRAAVGSDVTDDLEQKSREWDYSHDVIGVDSANNPEMGCLEFNEAKVSGVVTDTVGAVLGVSD